MSQWDQRIRDLLSGNIWIYLGRRLMKRFPSLSSNPKPLLGLSESALLFLLLANDWQDLIHQFQLLGLSTRSLPPFQTRRISSQLSRQVRNSPRY